MPTDTETYLRLAGRLHVLIIHFPIALIVTGLVCELGWMMRQKLRRNKAPNAAVPSPNETGLAQSAPVVARLSSTALVCLGLGALAAAVACVTGWLNADFEAHGDADAQNLFLHRWLGICAAALACVTFFIALAARRRKPRSPIGLYRAGLVLASAFVMVTGHYGGSMVYGEGYVLEPLRAKSHSVAESNTDPASPTKPRDPGAATHSPAGKPDSAAGAIVNAIDFASQIQPIFASRCVGCHGPARERGKLRLDTLDLALSNAQVIIPGNAADSELVRRINIPAGERGIMPAKGDPLAPEQIILITNWINQLPRESQTFGPPVGNPAQPDSQLAPTTTPESVQPAPAPPPPATTPPIVISPSSRPATSAESHARAEQPASEKPLILQDSARTARDAAFAALRARGAIASLIYDGSDAAEVDFALAGRTVADADLSLLIGLEPCLQRLNLGGAGVTDDGLKQLAPFTKLRRLRLHQTAITDAGLAHLQPLVDLTHLNLYSTGVSDDGLNRLATLKNLTRLFLWQTHVTPTGIEALQAALPKLQIDTGAVLTSQPVSQPDLAAAKSAQATGEPPPQPIDKSAAATPTTAPPTAAANPPTVSPVPADKAAASPAAPRARADCCLKSEAAGHLCEHLCCIEAAAAGNKVCPKCAPAK